MSEAASTPPFDARFRVVLGAALVLLLELALIRWAGSLVVHLSYFTNLILLGSFLGIGLGFLRASSKAPLFLYAPIALAGFVAAVHMAAMRSASQHVDLEYFGASPGNLGFPAWIVLPFIFLCVAVVMALTAQALARSFTALPPLEAYRWDILGSLFGITIFTVLSFVGAPPIGWGVAVAIGFLALAWPRVWIPLVGLLPVLAVLALQSLAPRTLYSPYYKLDIDPAQEATHPDGTPYTWIPIDVNSVAYQFAMRAQDLEITNPKYFGGYDAIGRPPENVLIIGGGVGNDAAVALSRGAGHVDVVEIDPVLARIGRERHPDRPYQDPRVDVYVDDGRAFLERSDEKYDLIVYSLPDSATLVTGQAGVRLESFLFTREAIQAAKEHLEPDGVFALFGYFPASWMTDRMALTMEEVFGEPACLPDGLQPDQAERGSLEQIVIGADICPTEWAAVDPPVASAPTDDRPFPYLRGASIPPYYLISLVLILGTAIAAVRWAGGPLRAMRTYLDLFFMGAAFLLLETKSVVQFALLFGTTWFVNALVFAGILLVVLAAVEVSRRVSFRHPIRLYPLLFATLAVAFLVPPSALLGLPMPARFVAAVLLTFTPVFLANLIFAQRFRAVEASRLAFAANLLGAMIGGLLEYASLVIGYRMLILGAAGLYALALLAGRTELKEQPA